MSSTPLSKDDYETERHPVALALFDYAPVFATAAAHYCLWQLSSPEQSSYWSAATSFVLVFFAGLSKATWKTINAFSGANYQWMSDFLFVGLPLGLAGMAGFLYDMWAGPNSKTLLIYLPLIITLPFYGLCFKLRHKLTKWFLPMVLPVALSTIAQGSFAFLYANKLGLGTLAWCFIASIFVSIVTSALSRKAKSFAVQWVMEISNTVAGLLLLLPALALHNL